MNELEFDPLMRKIARELREPVDLDPRLDARVMAAITAPEVIALESRRPPVPWYRRQLVVSAPLAGLAAAAAFAGIVAIGVLVRQPATPAVVAADTTVERLVPVANVAGSEAVALADANFIFVAPDARSVAVIGDFNDWHPTPMVWDAAARAWSLTLRVPVGVHQYQFLVNDTLHLTDPTATQATGDFGSPNSIIKVTPRP